MTSTESLIAQAVPVEALAAWVSANVASASGPLVVDHLSGGSSNLTFRVRDDANDWVLRRPPLGRLLVFDPDAVGLRSRFDPVAQSGHHGLKLGDADPLWPVCHGDTLGAIVDVDPVHPGHRFQSGLDVTDTSGTARSSTP